jgi:hypothetical protein
MGIRKLEHEILAKLREKENNPKIKLKDIQAWALANELGEPPRENETVVQLENVFGSRCIVAYLKPQRSK